VITAIGVCAFTVFLLLAGERISRRIRAGRAATLRRAWTTERHPAKQAAWRMYRNDEMGDQ
jgi:hypothetical protein